MSKLSEIKNRPATLPLSSRIDGRYLATLASFWVQNNEAPRSVSELVRLSLEVFTELLVSTKKIEMVERHVTALEVLNRLGLYDAKSSKSLAQNLKKALHAEDLALDSLTQFKDPLAPIDDEVNLRGGAPSQFEMAQAETRFEESMAKSLQTRVISAQNTTREFKEQMGIIPTKEEKDNV